ncbi:hypothetical protein BGP77_11480 [Saccharospirillum sp. MSK14-1]|uniref:3TM-type holin n=1 Tax=Saccharospirillum sp. MSK14-1 TaxID=1897632 RepID=UPI000D36B47D|nr:3TM-type holin [Saccharospirillum sp. MSK14-1]PTY38561.1 hypothetical protein BGP77_11480 [Saccharospirillum sp. MSK14-1]
MNWSFLKKTVGKVAPVAGSLLGGPAGGAVGGLIASALGVEATPDAVANAIESDPDAVLKLRQVETNHAEQMQRLQLEAETARLSQVNQTMRAEAAASDPFVRRWRPMFGYAVALTWVVQASAIAYAMVAAPNNAANIINAVTALTPMWGIALAVLGINVSKRSQDKQVAAGQQPSSILNLLKR